MTPEQYLTLTGWVLTGSLGLGLLRLHRQRMTACSLDLALEIINKHNTVADQLNSARDDILKHEASLCEFKDFETKKWLIFQKDLAATNGKIGERNNLLIQIGTSLGEQDKKLEAIEDRILKCVSQGSIDRLHSVLSAHSVVIHNLEKDTGDLKEDYYGNKARQLLKGNKTPVKPAISAVRKPLKKANGRAHARA